MIHPLLTMQTEEDALDSHTLRDIEAPLEKYGSPFGRNLWTATSQTGLDWRVVGSRPYIGEPRNSVHWVREDTPIDESGSIANRSFSGSFENRAHDPTVCSRSHDQIESSILDSMSLGDTGLRSEIWNRSFFECENDSTFADLSSIITEPYSLFSELTGIEDSLKSEIHENQSIPITSNESTHTISCDLTTGDSNQSPSHEYKPDSDSERNHKDRSENPSRTPTTSFKLVTENRSDSCSKGSENVGFSDSDDHIKGEHFSFRNSLKDRQKSHSSMNSPSKNDWGMSPNKSDLKRFSTNFSTKPFSSFSVTDSLSNDRRFLSMSTYQTTNDSLQFRKMDKGFLSGKNNQKTVDEHTLFNTCTRNPSGFHNTRSKAESMFSHSTDRKFSMNRLSNDFSPYSTPKRSLNHDGSHHDEPVFGDAFHLTISKKFSNMDPSQIVLWLGEPLYLVQFYSGRLDIAYCTDGTKEVGQFVILEADRGEDCGQVVSTTQKERYHALLAKLKDVPHEVVPKRIHRAALRKDIQAMLRKQQSEDEALKTCRQRVTEAGLQMEIVGCEYQWDMKKLTFFFISKQRVDFRDLVRDLFQIYQVRIWMCAIEKSKNNHLRNLMN